MDGNKGITGIISSLFGQSPDGNQPSLVFFLISMGASLACGLYICWIYKRTFQGVRYSRMFNVSLLMLTMGAALAVSAIRLNPLLSLGMLGAVSLVRFRTAVKENVDAVYILWAVTAGLGVAAGEKIILGAVLGVAIIGVIVYLVSLFRGKSILPFLFIIRHDQASANEVAYRLRSIPGFSRVKSRTVTKNGVELIVELRLAGHDPALENGFRRISGVREATLVNFQEDREID